MYYVVVSDVRYRYPVLWLSLLGAGYLLSDLTGFVTSVSGRSPVIAGGRGPRI